VVLLYSPGGAPITTHRRGAVWKKH